LLRHVVSDKYVDVVFENIDVELSKKGVSKNVEKSLINSITAGVTVVLFLLNKNSIHYRLALPGAGNLAREFLRNLFMGAKDPEVPL